MKRHILALTLFFYCQSIFAQLNGNYSIGNITSDYLTIDNAIDDLIALGVNGQVAFNIEPGNYTVHRVIPSITGSSAINTITFQSTLLDSNSVVLSYYAPSSSNNYLLKLNGCTYFTFQHLTFNSLANNSNKSIFVLNYVTNNITFSHNCFTSSNYSSAEPLIKGNGPGVDDIIIISNKFEGGGTQISFDGCCNSNYSENILISNNNFVGNAKYSIECEKVQHLTSKNNIHEGNRTNCLNLNSCLNFNIENNYYNITTSSNSGTAIFIQGGGGTFLDTSIIINNFVATNEAGGLSVSNCHFLNIYHNSFNRVGSEKGLFQVSSACNDLRVYNNVFHNELGKIVYNYDLFPTTVDFDYNVYHTTGSTIFSYPFNTPTTFQGWKDITGLDEHSLWGTNLFISNTDLHSNNSVLISGNGYPLNSIPYDFDGDLRSSISPDIGADEFIIDSLYYYDIELLSTIKPDTNSCFNSDSIIIKVVSHSIFPLDSITIKWTLFDNLMDSAQYIVNIPAYDTVTIALAKFDFNPETFYDFEFEIGYPNGFIDNYNNNNHLRVTYYHVEEVKIFNRIISDCNDSTLLFLKNFPRESILWSNGSTEPSITINSPGSYSVEVIDDKGCILTNTIIID